MVSSSWEGLEDATRDDNGFRIGEPAVQKRP